MISYIPMWYSSSATNEIAIRHKKMLIMTNIFA